MRNLLAFLGAMTVTVIAVGWYLGWYQVRRSNANLTIEVDTLKVGNDLRQAEQSLQKKLAERNERNNEQTGAKSTSTPKQIEPSPEKRPPVLEDDLFGLEEYRQN